MTTYTHKPTGITVETHDECGFTSCTTADQKRGWMRPDHLAAIHAAYLDSLGLWLDEPTGCLVDTASRSVRGSSTAFKVLQREAEGWTDDEGWTDRTNRDERDQAVDRYVATLAPPQPEPQPGEVWEVVSASGTHFLVREAMHDTCHVGNIAPSGRRLLITADGEWVGGES